MTAREKTGDRQQPAPTPPPTKGRLAHVSESICLLAMVRERFAAISMISTFFSQFFNLVSKSYLPGMVFGGRGDGAW